MATSNPHGSFTDFEIYIDKRYYTSFTVNSILTIKYHFLKDDLFVVNINIVHKLYLISSAIKLLSAKSR